MKYFYAILSEMDKRFMTRRLKKWEYYATIYLNQKEENGPQEWADTINLTQPNKYIF